MINIDFLTLKVFFLENKEFLIGAKIQKIQQPERRDFILTLRNNALVRKLYININPQYYHITFMSKENEEKRNIIIPQKPPMFCMLLRKYLEGCKIFDAKAVENERILELYFDSIDEFSCKRCLCLSIELMGKHSNVILYDRATYTIIGCAHNIGAEKSRYRELRGGLKYIYPPIQNKTLSNELKNQFRNLSENEIQKYLSATNFRPAISSDKYTLFAELLENSITQNSVSEMLDNYYAKFQEEINLHSEKHRLKEITLTKLRKIKNAINKISQLLAKRDNTEKYKLYGELLIANLYKQSNYQKQIDVYDYIHNENIIIELDESLSLKENSQKYYKLYTKSKITKEKSEKMLQELKIEQEYTENILYAIQVAEKISDLDEIKTELGVNHHEIKFLEKNKFSTNKLLAKKNEKIELIKLNIKGFDVYIGKNNKQNDYIVSKLAKDNDIWFHTRLCAGSHVLLKITSLEPEDEILIKCCQLAKEYSFAQQQSKVGVIYTKAKYLRKPPATPLGYVTYKNEKEILV